MTVTIPQIEAADPDSLTQSGAVVGRSASGLGDRITAQQATLEDLTSGWQGAASDAAIAKATPTLEQMRHMHASLTALQTALTEGGNTLCQNRTAVLQTVGRLSQQGWQVAPDGSVSVRPGGPLDQYAQLSAVNAMQVQQQAAAGSATLKSVLAAFDTADRRLGRDLRSAVAGLDVAPAGFGAPLPQTPIGPLIPVGKPADEVRTWWDGLAPAERDRLIAEQPDVVGNLEGVPVADRSAANTAAMERDIAVVKNATEAIPYDVMQRYYNAVEVKKGLEEHRRMTGAETHLYVYEPNAFDDQGRAAIAIGNPDDADNIAVSVPGTGNSVRDGWLSSDEPARLFDQTAKADPDKTTAVVAWMGYDAPDSPLDHRIGQPDLARQGGDLLADDVNAFSATTNRDDPHVTVIGHSYGSTTVADAAAGYGMRVDDVVLVGSPGTDLAQNAADFHLSEGGHVYVGAASTDPVSHLGGAQATFPGTDVTVGLGDDPAADEFGSTRFKAEVAGLTDPITDHTSYFVEGSESMYGMATIASGHGERLEELGMTADHRFNLGPFGHGPEIDPELIRPGSRGNVYE